MAWMLTFSDLLTLMLVFFVLLYSMSSMDDKKFEGAFGMMTGAFGALGKAKEAELTPDPFQAAMAPIPEFLVRDIKDLLQRHMREMPEEIIEPPEIMPLPEQYDEFFKVDRIDEGVEVSIAAAILFDKSGYKLLPRSVRLLREVGDEVARWGVPARIEAYVDPDTRNRDAAWDLSIYRASTVTNVIVGVKGVDQKLLSMMGYGRPAPRRLQADSGGSLVRVIFYTNKRDAAFEQAEIIEEVEVK